MADQRPENNFSSPNSNAIPQTGSKEDGKTNTINEVAASTTSSNGSQERAVTPAQPQITHKKSERKRHSENHIGLTPDAELVLVPKWLVFSAEENYRSAQYATFSIKNTENRVIAFRLRTRDRLFPQMSYSNGILEPKQSVEVICYIPAHEQWPRDINEYMGKVHKVVVESLLVPETMVIPQNTKDKISAVRGLFHNTAAKAPLTRLYIKLKIILPVVAGILPQNSVSPNIAKL